MNKILFIYYIMSSKNCLRIFEILSKKSIILITWFLGFLNESLKNLYNLVILNCFNIANCTSNLVINGFK